MTAAITVDGVSKSFRINVDRVSSIKERVLRAGRTQHQEFWALNEMSFEVGQGETIGILGHNGSGKSTLLKCVAGILKPTTGEIRLRGRVASLLELGSGFHPDLTGRENVYINASFLHISRKEIERRFDEIVAFAELDQFIDNQVKHYSSGMYVRLAFAVAINVDPDILLVDEVLAVGDEVFQKKCLNRVEQMQADGKTIVLVTHAADIARQICDRVMVIDHGNLVANGAPGESIRIFREYLHGTLSDEEPIGGETVVRLTDGPVRITGVRIEHPGQPDRRYLLAGEPLTIRVGYNAAVPLEDAIVSLQVRDTAGETVYSADTDQLGASLPTLSGNGEVVFHIGSVPLLDGAFPLTIQLKDRHGGRLLDFREKDSFEVVNPTRTSGSVLLPVSVEVREHTAADQQLSG